MCEPPPALAPAGGPRGLRSVPSRAGGGGKVGRRLQQGHRERCMWKVQERNEAQCVPGWRCTRPCRRRQNGQLGWLAGYTHCAGRLPRAWPMGLAPGPGFEAIVWWRARRAPSHAAPPIPGPGPLICMTSSGLPRRMESGLPAAWADALGGLYEPSHRPRGPFLPIEAEGEMQTAIERSAAPAISSSLWEHKRRGRQEIFKTCRHLRHADIITRTTWKIITLWGLDL